jgi:hypothetical protein
MFAVLWTVWHRVQPPWWDTAADVQELHDFIEDGAGYEGTDEYVPVGVDASNIDRNAPLVTTTSGRPVTVHIQNWTAENKTFSTESAVAETLRLRLFNYPAWQADVNGEKAKSSSQPDTGEILISVEAGINRVHMRFARTLDRFVGGLCSVMALLVLLCWQFLYKRHETA